MNLRNRIVMPAMRTVFAAPNGAVTKRLIDYYVERAKGGVGLIIVEHAYMDTKESKSGICQLGVYTDHLIPGLNELVEAIKTQGANTMLQLNHGGGQSRFEIMNMKPVAPSAVPYPTSMPRELTLKEIEEIIEAFGEAGKRAKMAGFDGVEIHGAHGYLICEFQSPYTNKRNDKYGGSFKARARFPLEVVEKVREKVGTNFTVGYKISVDEYVEGGLTLEESQKFAKMLEDAGVDYIGASSGIYATMHHQIQPMYLPHGYIIHLAEGIKRAVNIPVIGFGSIDVETGEKIIEEEKADLIAMGRGLIADPEIPKKLAQGRIEDICPCIRCLECRVRLDGNRTLRCAVNANVGREGEEMKTAEKKKKVLIVGGGVAGMEAARVATLRGHKVILYEREDKLGGHLVEASIPSFKEDLKELIRWFSKQLEQLHVEIKLGIEVTPKLVNEIKPDTIILAVGSSSIIPDIPGITKPDVTTAVDMLVGKTKLDDTNELVVVGGGFVGCETALYLVEDQGTPKVTIVEMLDEIAMDVELLSKRVLLERLNKAGVKMLAGMKLEEITDDGIICIDKKWNRHHIKADKVVLALGFKPRTQVVKQLKGLASEVYEIGDCVEVRKIRQAVDDGWRTARMI